MNYDVIGFAKCGTVSLQRYLLNKGHDCTKNEWPVYWEIDKLRKHLGNRTPVLIKRNRIESIWSFYQYFNLQYLDFEGFLNLKLISHNFPNLTPLEIFDYDRWIKRLEPLNPLVYDLEELMKDDTFPHENITICKNNIPNEIREILIKY